MAWLRRKMLLLATAVFAAAGTGCYPTAMGILTPVPMQPWVTERMEQKYAFKNDFRTPIMPPIRDGFPAPKIGRAHV